MPDRVRVDYSRKVSTQTNGQYNTESFSAGWEFDIPDGVSFQDAYARGLEVVKGEVEAQFTAGAPVVAQQPVREAVAATLPGERFAKEPQRSTKETNGAIIEGQEYEFTNARVWNVELGRTQRGKQFIKVRIGSKDQIPGTGYASVKSYNPQMISKLSALQEGDHVDVRGVYEGWDGRDGRMYDFVPSEVERVRDVRSS